MRAQRLIVSGVVVSLVAGLGSAFTGVAFADPAPGAGAECVPVRIISADGTWSEGDQSYLNQVIEKVKASNSGNVAASGNFSVDILSSKNNLPASSSNPGEQRLLAVYLPDGPPENAIPGTGNQVANRDNVVGKIPGVAYVVVNNWNQATVDKAIADGWVIDTPDTANQFGDPKNWKRLQDVEQAGNKQTGNTSTNSTATNSLPAAPEGFGSAQALFMPVDADNKAVKAGTDMPVHHLIIIRDLDAVNDAGIQIALDSGWLPYTAQNLKAVARQSAAARLYLRAVEMPPVAVGMDGDRNTLLYFKDDAGIAKAKQVYEGLPVAIADEPKADAAATEDYTDGREWLQARRDDADQATVGLNNQPSESEIQALSTRMRDASAANPTPAKAQIPSDLKPAELPPVPDPWAASPTENSAPEPTIEPNPAVPSTPAAENEAAPPVVDDSVLNGDPNAATGTAPEDDPADTSTGGDDSAPTIEANPDAPATSETPTTSSDDESTSTSTTSADDESTPTPTTSTAPDSSTSEDDVTDLTATTVGTYDPFAPKNTGDKAYDSEKVASKQKLAAELTQVANDCPDTKFVLLGAREGAGAVGDLAADIGNGRGPIPADRVIAVGLLSDPERNAADGQEGTVPDYNKRCVIPATSGEQTDKADNTTATTTSSAPNYAPKGSGAPKANTASADIEKDVSYASERTLGQDCAPTNGGSGSKNPQLVGETVEGAGIYGGRTQGFGSLSGRSATVCMQSDQSCATSRENSLVALLADVATGDQSKTPQAVQASLTAAMGLFKLLGAIDFNQVSSMASSVQKVAVSGTVLTGAVGSLIAAPNPASFAAALAAAAPTAQGVLEITGGVLQTASQLVTAYETMAEMPQVVDFINLINPDTETGKKVLAAIPNGSSPEVTGALRAVIPVLNALNSIPKGQVLSMSGTIASTTAGAITDPTQIPMVLSNVVQLFSTVISSATGMSSNPKAVSTVGDTLDPYPLGSDSDTNLSTGGDYGDYAVNGNGTSAVDWMSSWISGQANKSLATSGTSGVSGGAQFGGPSSGSNSTMPGTRPNYSGAPGGN